MAAMTIQNVIPGGLTAAFAAVNSSDTIQTSGDDRVFLHVKNGGGSSINVTITADRSAVNVKNVGNLSISNIVKAVAAGAEAIIGPFSAAYVASDNKVTVGYSATTSVTAAALKLVTQI
jgi:hypothetical protein